MKELVIEHLSKTYGVKQLLDDVTLSVRTGDRIGLIGANGVGKSSFLKVVAGIDHYDDGVLIQPKQYTISMLRQQPELDENQTLLEAVYSSESPIVQLVKRYEEICQQLAAQPNNQSLQDVLMRLNDEMTHQEAWTLEVKAKTILTQLGLTDLTKKVGDCSGGEQKRVGIAKALIAEPDLLLLDEPTNHLDIETIEWLSQYLSTYTGALIVVTHDRHFLDKVANKIIELQFGKFSHYTGNYEDYLNQKAIEMELQYRAEEKEDKLFKQELDWMRQGAKARTTKQQARINRFNDLKSTIHSRTSKQEMAQLDFNQQRIGNRIMTLEDVTISMNNQAIVEHLTKEFVKGDCLGIIGRNGVGKTTLMNVLAQDYSIDSGTYEIGQTVRMAYYRQFNQDLPSDMRVLAYITKIADQFKREDGSTMSAAQLLEKFQFARETHGTLIGQLSGGERRRLYLVSLLAQQPNVLLLDEPTNDLDIETLRILENYIESFDGVVIMISHDRYFIDNSVTQLLELEGNGKFTWYWGNYTDYLEQKQLNQQLVQQEGKEQPVTSTQLRTSSKKMTYDEKKEWAIIEQTISDTESSIEEVQAEMVQSSSDAATLMALQEQLDTLEERLLTLYERYEYLSEFEKK